MSRYRQGKHSVGVAWRGPDSEGYSSERGQQRSGVVKPLSATVPEVEKEKALSPDARRYARDAGRYSSEHRGDSLAKGFQGAAASEVAARHHAKRRPVRIKRIIVIVLIALACACAAIAAAFFVYMNQLNHAISLGSEDQAAFGLLGETPTGPYYTLVIGSDTRSEDQYQAGANDNIEGERADVIILARIDEAEKKVTLLSIPRDTPWTDGEGRIRKINESYYGGAASVIDAVEGIAGVNVNHYVRVRFSGFEDIVDALGGVTVDVPQTVSYNSATTGEMITVEAGEQTLDGEHALVFARARHEYGDNQEQVRQSNVRTLIGAITDRMKQIPLTDLPGIVMEAASCVGTDISSYDLLHLGFTFRDGMTMYGASAPYKGSVDEAAGGVWLCYDDREGWRKVMEAVDSGQDPASVSYAGDVAYIAGTEETVVIE